MRWDANCFWQHSIRLDHPTAAEKPLKAAAPRLCTMAANDQTIWYCIERPQTVPVHFTRIYHLKDIVYAVSPHNIGAEQCIHSTKATFI